MLGLKLIYDIKWAPGMYFYLTKPIAKQPRKCLLNGECPLVATTATTTLVPSHPCQAKATHYSDVIMSMIASQITSLSIVYPTVCSGPDQRKFQSSASLAFVTGEFPAQRPVTRKNVSTWWLHHVTRRSGTIDSTCTQFSNRLQWLHKW